MKDKAKKKLRLFGLGASAKAKAVRERARARLHGLWVDLLGVLLSPWRFFKIFCFTIGFCVICGSVVVSVYVNRFFQSIPRVDRLTLVDLQRMGEAVVHKRL